MPQISTPVHSSVLAQFAGRMPRGEAAKRAFRSVLLLSFAIRLVALVLARHLPFVSDGGDYVEMARLLWSGQHFLPYWPPGVPLYLVPFVAAGGSIILVRAAMLLFWALGAWAIYRLARALALADFAWLILLVFSVMPSTIHMSIEPVTQQPVAALLLLALSATIECANAPSRKEYVILGCSIGWLALTRTSALPLLLLLPAASLLRPKASLQAVNVRGALLSATLGIVIVGAWMVRTYATTGFWMINNSNAVNIFYGNNPWTPLYRTWYFGSQAKVGSAEIERFPEYKTVLEQTSRLPPIAASSQYNHLVLSYITHRPDLFAIRTFNRIQCFFGFDTFTSANLRSDGPLAKRLFPLSLALEAALFLLVAGPAFFWLAAAPGNFWTRRNSLVITGTILVYSLPYWLSMSHPTYHYPIMLPLAFLGILAWRYAKENHARPNRGWVAVAVLAAIQLTWVVEMTGALKAGH